MSFEIRVKFCDKQILLRSDTSVTGNEIIRHLQDVEGLSSSVYLIRNGRLCGKEDFVPGGEVHVFPRLLGGKGGFGSMLRAIGAQIEKTTNREACRDLSGRRLRDINEEKRLKKWIAQQAEREKEAAERRRQKLERLVAEPKHDFKDEEYDQARTELTEKVYDAVEQGFKASTSGVSVGDKRKATSTDDPKKKKKRCLWIDDIEDDLSSDELSDEEGAQPVAAESRSSEDSSEDKKTDIRLLPDPLPDSGESKESSTPDVEPKIKEEFPLPSSVSC